MRNMTRRGFLLGSASLGAASIGACGKNREPSPDDVIDASEVDLSTLDEIGRERAREEIRHALAILFDREYICDSIGQVGYVPANTFVPRGTSEPDGTDFCDHAGKGDGKGYFDPTDEAIESNFKEAMAIFRKYYDYDENTGRLTNFKPMSFLYMNSQNTASIGEYLQGDFDEIGITLNLENQEENTYLQNIQSGNYQTAFTSWALDFLDPIDMLNLCMSTSTNNTTQLGKAGHATLGAYSLDLTDEGIDVSVENGTWAETFDVLIEKINDEVDDERRFRLMHKAEDLIMETGVVCPIFYGTRPYLLKSGIDNFWLTPLGIADFLECTSANLKSLDVTYGPEPDSLDPALCTTTGAASMVRHMFSGLAKMVEDDDEEGFKIVADCAEELVEGVENEDGTYTFTYTLRDGLTWSDGQPVTAHDFEFAWKRAASPDLGSNFREFFTYIKGYKDNDLAVTATDDKTLEVTLVNPVGFWEQLLSFSVFYPVRADVVANENWADDVSTYVCNGAFVLGDWVHDSTATIKKRADYHAANEVGIDEIVWYFSDNAVTNLNNYESGNWQFTANLPSQEIGRIKEQYPDEFHIAHSASLYYLMFNVNFDLLPS